MDTTTNEKPDLTMAKVQQKYCQDDICILPQKIKTCQIKISEGKKY